jgi:hypothetical protein
VDFDQDQKRGDLSQVRGVFSISLQGSSVISRPLRKAPWGNGSYGGQQAGGPAD